MKTQIYDNQRSHLQAWDLCRESRQGSRLALACTTAPTGPGILQPVQILVHNMAVLRIQDAFPGSRIPEERKRKKKFFGRINIVKLYSK